MLQFYLCCQNSFFKFQNTPYLVINSNSIFLKLHFFGFKYLHMLKIAPKKYQYFTYLHSCSLKSCQKIHKTFQNFFVPKFFHGIFFLSNIICTLFVENTYYDSTISLIVVQLIDFLAYHFKTGGKALQSKISNMKNCSIPK